MSGEVTLNCLLLCALEVPLRALKRRPLSSRLDSCSSRSQMEHLRLTLACGQKHAVSGLCVAPKVGQA